MPTQARNPKEIDSRSKRRLGRASPSRRIESEMARSARIPCVVAHRSAPLATVIPNPAQMTAASSGYTQEVTAVTSACARKRLQPSRNR